MPTLTDTIYCDRCGTGAPTGELPDEWVHLPSFFNRMPDDHRDRIWKRSRRLCPECGEALCKFLGPTEASGE